MLLPMMVTLLNVARPNTSEGDDMLEVVTANRGRSISGRERNDENSEVEGGEDTRAHLNETVDTEDRRKKYWIKFLKDKLHTACLS